MAERKTEADYHQLVCSFVSSYPLKRGYVAQLLEFHTKPSTLKMLIELANNFDNTLQVNKNSLRGYIACFHKKLTLFKTAPHAFWEELCDTMAEDFPIPTYPDPLLAAVATPTTSPVCSKPFSPIIISAASPCLPTPTSSRSVPTYVIATPSVTTSSVGVSFPAKRTYTILVAPVQAAHTVTLASTPSLASITLPTSMPLAHTSTSQTPAVVTPTNTTQYYYKNTLGHTQSILGQKKKKMGHPKIKPGQEEDVNERKKKRLETCRDPRFTYRLTETVKRKSQSVTRWREKYKEVKSQLAVIRRELVEKTIQLNESEKDRTRLLYRCTTLQEKCEKAEQSEKRSWNERDKTLTAIEKYKKQSYVCRRKLRDKVTAAQVGMTELFFDQEHKIDELSALLKTTKETSKVVKCKIGNKRYSDNIRKCVYFCLCNNVAVEKVEKIIKYVVNSLCNKSLTSFPSSRMISRMAYELGVLADIQIGHVLKTACDVATIGMDATTFQGSHVNELHIIVSPGQQKLTLDLSVLAGGSADDYTGHISQVLHDVAQIYSMANGLEEDAQITMTELFCDKLKSAISDRAPVNRCVFERLREELDLDLLDLKCAVHPLDGLARSTRSVLATLDKDWKITSSSDCQAEVLIRSLAKLRLCGDDGDPVGFHAFLKEKQLKKGIFQRYVGKRFHMIFHMGAIIFDLREELLRYLRSRINKPLAVECQEILQKPLIQVQLLCLGLFSKVLTGPWMREIYSNPKNRSNLQVAKDGLYKACVDKLAQCESSPDLLLATPTDVFGHPLDPADTLLASLRSQNCVYLENKALVHFCISRLADAFGKTLKCQLKDYLEGPLSEATEEMLAATASAPVHNMHAERVLAMMDALWRRAPNATLGFIDGKVRGVMNRTVEWLDGIEPELQNRYIQFCMQHAPKVKLHRAQRKEKVDRAIKNRHKQSAKKVDRKKRSELESQIIEKLSSASQVLSMPCFAHLSVKVKDKLQNFLKDSTCLCESVLEHVWTEADGKDTTFYELVKTVETSNNDKGMSLNEVVLYYWKADESLTGDVIYLPVPHFLADFALGDLKFVD